jgi:ABC-2 type transport system ATP-binding protein
MNDSVILRAEALSKTFRVGTRVVKALGGVDLSIHPGVVTGLIGPDGAGKTTLMRLAAGLLVPDSGRVEVLGLDATRESLRVQADLGYMPQRFGLYEDLTVRENLDLYADLRGVPIAARPERYDTLTRMTGLAPFTGRLAGKLSGGMKQKLGLACTLVRAPKLLLLDEPTVGVDPVSRRELWAIVDRLVQEAGMSVLLSTAYLDEAERCAEVILLHEGHVLDQGEPGALSARLAGRSWVVTRAGRRPRDIQAELDGQPGILDALVQGEHVRVVTEGTARPEAMRDLDVNATPPRFEDGFVDLLRHHAVSGTRVLGARARSWAPTRAAEPGDSGAVIEVRGLERRFGDFKAVAGIDFSIRRGEIFGLLGANGAGKTTTFRMLCGLLPASAGQLRVAGVDLRHAAAAARARIGYMSQKFSLYGNLSVAQNLEFFARVYGLAGARLRERLDWALTEFELATHRDQLKIGRAHV